MYKVVRLVMRWAPVVGLLVFTGLDMALLLHWVAAGLVLVARALVSVAEGH
jgi:hypothetical protein